MAAMKHGYQKVRFARQNYKLIQGVADNFECLIPSPNGLKQTYSMGVIMTQGHTSTDMPDSDPDYISRKSKQDLQSYQFPGAKIYYCKGPTNPPMSKSNSKLQVLHLKILVSA